MATLPSLTREMPVIELRRLEEIGLNASATPRQLFYDGWLLRLSPGKAKRPRSVNPFYGSTLDLDAKLRYCASVYAAHGLPCLFRLTPFVQPAELDVELGARGFVRFDETLVQVAPLRPVALRLGKQLPHVAGTCSDVERWAGVYAELRGLSLREANALREQLALGLQTRWLLVVESRGKAVACGMALLEDGVIGLFNIATAPDARDRGHGTRVVEALLAWGASAGAHSAYLQVNDTNAPALAVYRKFGFATAYSYWYRARREHVE